MSDYQSCEKKLVRLHEIKIRLNDIISEHADSHSAAEIFAIPEYRSLKNEFQLLLLDCYSILKSKSFERLS